MLLDVDSVLKSPNAIDSVLFNIFSGVLATVKKAKRKGKFNQYLFEKNLLRKCIHNTKREL